MAEQPRRKRHRADLRFEVPGWEIDDEPLAPPKPHFFELPRQDLEVPVRLEGCMRAELQKATMDKGAKVVTQDVSVELGRRITRLTLLLTAERRVSCGHRLHGAPGGQLR